MENGRLRAAGSRGLGVPDGVFVLLLSLLPLMGSAQTLIPAFPGAEGHGALASGGRGGSIVHVTNLEDAAQGVVAGSLRAAAQIASTPGAPEPPRIVVFDVSGIIQLKRQLRLRGNLTIAGQTAPGGGVIIRSSNEARGDLILIENRSNIVLRHLRLRAGWYEPFMEQQGINIKVVNSKNLVLDHVSTSWSVDDDVLIWGSGQFGRIARIGMSSSATYPGHFAGDLDDLRFYDYNLTAGDLSAVLSRRNGSEPAAGMLAQFTFDDNLLDAAGDHSAGGSAAFAAFPLAGFPDNKVLDLAGAEVLNLANTDELNKTSRTVAFWAKPDAAGPQRQPVFAFNTANFDIGFVDGRMYTRLLLRGGREVEVKTADAVVEAGAWRHYAYTARLTGDMIALQFYRDGVLVDEAALDEADLTLEHPTENISFQNSIISEGLWGATDHSTGMMIRGDSMALPSHCRSEDYLRLSGIDIHHNLFMSNSHRNPIVTAGGVRLLNNVVYNWAYGAHHSQAGAKYDAVNNAMIAGPDLIPLRNHPIMHESREQSAEWHCAWATPSIFVHGNVHGSSLAELSDPTADNWNLLRDFCRWLTICGYTGPTEPENRLPLESLPDSYRRTLPQLDEAPVPVRLQSAQDALNRATAGDVGADGQVDCEGTWTKNPDAVDVRLIKQLNRNQGRIPNYETDACDPDTGACGFPALAAGAPCADADTDGLPDEWEQMCSGSPSSLSPHDDMDGDGYTNMEAYINGMGCPGSKHNPADVSVRVDQGTATISWSPVPGAVGYRLAIGQDGGPANCYGAGYQDVSGTSRQVSVSSPGTLYTARICAVTTQGFSSGTLLDIDTTPPGVELSSESPTNDSPFTAAIHFSEPVTGFSASDIAIDGGAAGAFSGSGDSYSIEVIPGESALTIRVPAGVAEDSAGNTNTASTPLQVVYDNLGPMPEISLVDDPPAAAPFAVQIRFGEVVTGFTAEDITVNGATKGFFSGSGADYLIWITPAARNLTIGVAAGAAIDSLGNSSLAAQTLNITAPTAAIRGTVTLNAVPLEGVIVSAGVLGTHYSNSLGQYEISQVLLGAQYTVAPSKTGFTFVPAVRSGTLAGEVTADFAAALSVHSLSGTVRHAGRALPGVVIDGGGLGSRTTDSEGRYSFSGIPYGTSYAIRAEKERYQFDPGSSAGTISSDTVLNFATTDSDDDGISDAQERLDGSDWEDRGSNLPVLTAEVCSEWNGFLGMWNIMEHVNMTDRTLTIDTVLFSIAGEPQDSHRFWLPPGAQQDVLVHDLLGWIPDSYGKVCSTVLDGQPGDLDGRMVYYKPADPGYAAHQFVFAMPFLNGITGVQFVPFNTFHPSQDAADAGNLVANWIQLTNLEHTPQNGTLIFHAQDGSMLGSPVSVHLEGGARHDFSGHQFGRDLVGIIEWHPDDHWARFQLRNVRYIYDNTRGANSFDTAFQLEGTVGNGEPTTAFLDTAGASAIIEVANTTQREQYIALNLYSEGGTPIPVDFGTLHLPAFGSRHVIVDSILRGGRATAVIDGGSREGVMAVVMQYGRTGTGGIKYVYGIQARQPLGSVLRSSYNTFLGQDCRLLLANPAGLRQTAVISMTRYDGARPVDGQELSVPGHGLLVHNLCAAERPDAYGVVVVQPAERNSLAASLLRLGRADEYRLPIPVRQ